MGMLSPADGLCTGGGSAAAAAALTGAGCIVLATGATGLTGGLACDVAGRRTRFLQAANSLPELLSAEPGAFCARLAWLCRCGGLGRAFLCTSPDRLPILVPTDSALREPWPALFMMTWLSAGTAVSD